MVFGQHPRHKVYRLPDCSNCLVNKDAWKVTPRQRRRFDAHARRAGWLFRGTGLTKTQERILPHD